MSNSNLTRTVERKFSIVWGGEAFGTPSAVCACRALLLAGAAVALLAAHSVQGANVSWDITPGIVGTGNGTVTGGAGTWDTTTGNWTIDGGINNVAWVNANNDTAIFSGTAGTVTLGAGITVGGLQFNTTAYGITTGANTLTFGAANNTIAFNSVAAGTITGTVAGTGSNLILTALSPATTGNLTFNGVSTGGWTGTTTINTGMTLTTTTTSGVINQVLNNTSGITLNGGAIQFNRATNAQLNAIADGAAITVNGGGTLGVTSADAGGASAIENIGTVTVNSGQMNFNWTNGASSGAQMVMSGLSFASPTATATFSGALALTGRWKVTGAGSTTAGQIIGPWATTGGANGIAVQTDYAVFGSDFVAAAGIAASAESTWTNAANAYTSNAGTGAILLTGPRNITALRSISAASTVTVTANSATIAQATHAFAVGDPVVFAATTMPTGLTAGTVYYVVTTAAGTFQVAATPGGTAIAPTTAGTSVNVTGALQVSSGNNLGTTGILNGVATTLTIAATGTGAVTLPTTTAGNLFITPGTGPITINAPIQDNTGALTLVKSDTGGTLTLNGANTFTGGLVIHTGGVVISNNAGNTYSGGITINGGSLTPATDTGLGNTLQTITFGTGNGSLIFSSYGSANSSARTGAIIVNGAGTMQMSFQTGPNIAMPITGAGTLTLSSTGGSGSGTTFTSTASTFTGPLILANPAAVAITMNSLGSGDAGTFLQFGTGAQTSAPTFTYAGSTALSGRSLVLGGGALTGTFNNNGTGVVTFSQNLGFAGAGAKTLALGGSNTGTNLFSGNIADGPGSVVNLTKTGNGNWLISGNMSNTGGLFMSAGTLTLSGTNTYSGQTNFNGGGPTLVFAGMQAISPNTSFLTNSNASTGASTIKLLDDTGGVNNSTVSVSNTFTIQNNNTPGNSHTFIVGNNNTANGGTSSGTTTGSTIAIGTLNWGTEGSGTIHYGPIPIQGTNGYRLQINNVVLFNAGNAGVTAGTNTDTFFTPTNANVTLGNVTMATGNNALGVPFLVLDGTSSDNRITGTISNATDALTTGRPLNLTKSNSSAWTLSGNNTFTGLLTLTGATAASTVSSLTLSGDNTGMTGGVTVNGNATSGVSGTVLNINSPTAIGTGTLFLGTSPSTINNTSGSTVTLTTNNAMTWNQDFTFTGTNSLNMGAGTVSMGGNRNVTVSANTLSIGSINSNAFNLQKLGNGTLSLSGAAAYTGTTTVTGGTLNILSTNTTSGVVIAAAGTLRGTGSLTGTGAITFSGAGSVFPGDATQNSLTDGPKGNFTAVSANFNTGGGTLKIRALSTGPTGSMTSDSLTISTGGVLTLGGSSKLDLRIQSFTAATSNTQDSLIVDNGTIGGSTATFGTVTVTYPATGQTGVELIYASTGFSANSTPDTDVSVYGTQQPNAAFVANSTGGSATSYNKIYVRLVANSVAPVKVADFAAKAMGSGVLVSWTAISEYQNAGFNIYRRALESSEWVKANPTLIAGRLTNPDEKKYAYFDWATSGMFEYKLESIDLSGTREVYGQLTDVVEVDTLSPLAFAAEVSAETIDAAIQSIDMEAGSQIAQSARVVFETLQKSGATDAATPSIKGAARAIVNRLNSDDTVAKQVQLQMPAAGARWFSSNTMSASTSYSVAKIMYKDSGVLRIPQASMPAGFDLGHVALQREGRSFNALAQVPGGMLVYAPGYNDSYTDKDAIFLRKTATATPAGIPAKAMGLFSSSTPVHTTSSNTVTTEYHDVYFDYNMRPYTFEPWFSSKYLTQGSSQDFTLNLPDAVSDTAALGIKVWSLTSSEKVNPDHGVQVLVNGQPIGETSWDGGGKMLQLSFAIPSGTFKTGLNVVSLVTPSIEGQDAQIAFLHSMSVTYTRALDGSKPVAIANNSDAPLLYELYNVPATGAWVVDTRFADRAALVPAETMQQADGTMRLRFIAAAGGNGKYLVVPIGQENNPLSVNARLVKPLKLNGTYLATGPAQFAPGVQPLLAKRAKEGIRGAFVDQEQLFDNYNFGRFGPEGIRKAVRSVRPAYLLLVGRTTYDYLNYSGANVDPLCPAFLVSTSFWAQTTSDSAFGDLGRGYPEVAVGRLPIVNGGELAVAVSHIVNYKGIPSSGVRLHAVADKTDSSVANFGAQLDETIKASNPDITWQENYLERTYPTAPEVTAAMKVAANGGADVIVYSGHGNASRLGATAPRILDQTSVQQWTGNTVFLQATCAANWMAYNLGDYRSIAIQALTQPQGGISASISTSTFMNPDVATAFMNQLLKGATGSGARWGTVLLKTQQWAGFQSGSAFYKDMMTSEHLFGDPAMSVFAPKSTVSAPSPGTSPNAPAVF